LRCSGLLATPGTLFNMKLSSIISTRHRSRFSSKARNYFNRLDAAGDTTYTAYKQPLANYIDSLVALGGAYWDTMESSASFVGVGIQGVTVPLRDGMPSITNNNFVAGDLNQLTGLRGNGSTKYLSTGINATDLSQNDASISTYVTVPDLSFNYLAGAFGGLLSKIALVSTGTSTRADAFTGATSNDFGTALGVGLLGASRSSSTSQDRRSNQTNYPHTVLSEPPVSATIDIFTASGIHYPTYARIATYHVGPALNLATIEGLQETLILEVAAI